MASLSFRNTKHHARIRLKGFPTVCKAFHRRSDALTWSRQVEADMQAGRWRPERQTAHGIETFGDLLDVYLDRITPSKKGATQERNLIGLIRAADECSALCAKPVAEVRQGDVAGLRDHWLDRGLKPATVRNRLALISHSLEVARKEFEINAENVVRSIRKPQARNERSRRFMDGEADRIIAATQSDDLPAFLTVALETGMRRGELCGLEWERVDLERRTITLRTSKNGAPRLVPLSPRARAALRDLPRRTDGKVFGFNANCASFAFAWAVRRARELYVDEQRMLGLPVDDAYLRDLRLHDGRHTALSNLAENGWDVLDIAAVSGHRSWSCLRRYVHAKASRLADKLDTLDASFQALTVVPAVQH